MCAPVTNKALGILHVQAPYHADLAQMEGGSLNRGQAGTSRGWPHTATQSRCLPA